MDRPAGVAAWADTTRVSKYPLVRWWRSTHAPVWNHRIVAPVVLWDEGHGTHVEAIDAVREGREATLGLTGPDREAFVTRMEDEDVLAAQSHASPAGSA